MEQLLEQFVLVIQSFVSSNNIFISIFFGAFAILLESILPMLPLAVFIAINIIAFGNIGGFLISWISTIIGCSISFFICRKCRNYIERHFKNNKILNLIDKINNIEFYFLVLILAMPFTPAFSINIAAGLSNMKYKRYLLALLISKISIIYFWGYIGSTLINNVIDVEMIVKLFLMIIILFVVSKIMMKRFDL